MDKNELCLGKTYPLGATFDGKGTNFAVFAAEATQVELCFFNVAYGTMPNKVVNLTKDQDRWFGYVAGVKPGQLYGYRVHGPHEHEQGKRYNAAKLLVDPYARAITPAFEWHPSLFNYPLNDERKDLIKDDTDSAPYAPKGIVVDPFFDWKDDRPPRIPFAETIIYELHVKGFTQNHPQIPENLRGTYAGLAHPASITYLKALGITSIELMPVHQFVNDKHLIDKGLTNYWGYNTLGFFAPHEAYSSDRQLGAQVTEFKEMVRLLHAAGLEVILDVVYNHTAEGNELGPTLSFKGLDNAVYYRLEPQMRYYTDYTGTGNTFNTTSDQALQLVMDSLRYWVEEMHVDGFRFDIAATLVRGCEGQIDHHCAFLHAIYQDPVLSQVKLIAEPWDVGEDGYLVGKFKRPWSEWNGKFRDHVRSFWNADDCTSVDFVQRLLGSPDLYKQNGRLPTASINFITAHDGFTLLDLVSYNEKHNEANADDNTDGESDNISCNFGVEGDTHNERILAQRKRQQRNLLISLFLAQGVPMLCAGDEMGKTQQGNNNAYCQDNEISYLNWAKQDVELLAFTSQLIQLRKMCGSFRQPNWVDADSVHFFTPRNKRLSSLDDLKKYRSFVLQFVDHPATFYLCVNAEWSATAFKLPVGDWEIGIMSDSKLISGKVVSGEVTLIERSMLLVKSCRPKLLHEKQCGKLPRNEILETNLIANCEY